ncbi:MAG: tRNA 2-thiouridine(34) synthase MnmA [Spirochaetota bacterium]|nr:tRNA 2-thiouridine(34) synthase MnmA [Spirochaetota bacterium]
MRIAVAMSGGVDSSVTAIMLQKLGHEVIGITANMLSYSEFRVFNHKKTNQTYPPNIFDAKRIAKQHDFAHKILDLNEVFFKEIVSPFCGEYLKGRTPSPCILCNVRIKFKRLLDYALSIGCNKLATGHYARISRNNSGRYCVSMGLDKDKDQSYFLCMLPQEALQRVIFPLGDYNKSAILKMAHNFDLHVAEKPESQEICFIPDQDYTKFIENITCITPKEGDIVDTAGNVIGRHKGIHRYTIGQRRGMGISHEKPLYVVKIDSDKNIIIAGEKEELFSKGLFGIGINYMFSESLDKLEVLVKTRSTQIPFKALLNEKDNGVYAYFDEPQIQITPGQAAVFYNSSGNILGSAWIEKSL